MDGLRDAEPQDLGLCGLGLTWRVVGTQQVPLYLLIPKNRTIATVLLMIKSTY